LNKARSASETILRISGAIQIEELAIPEQTKSYAAADRPLETG